MAVVIVAKRVSLISLARKGDFAASSGAVPLRDGDPPGDSDLPRNRNLSTASTDARQG